MVDVSLGRLEEFVEVLASKLPGLPTEVRGAIVVWGPFIVLAVALLTLANLALVFFEGALPGTLGIFNYYLMQLVNLIFGLALLSSFRPLQQKKLTGWRTLFFLNSLYLLLSLVIFGFSNILLIALSYYLLFQVRPYFS